MRNGAHWSNSGGSTICGKRGDSVCDRSMTRTLPPASAPASSAAARSLIPQLAFEHLLALAEARDDVLRDIARIDVLDAVAQRRDDRARERRGASFGGGTSWFHSSSIGPGNTFTTRMPAWRISARRFCDSAKAAAFEAENVPCEGSAESA